MRKMRRGASKLLAILLSATLLAASTDVSTLQWKGVESKMAVVEAASDGCTTIGVTGEFETPDMEALLKRVNEIRLEACKNGYPNPNNGQPLTMSDYTAVGWNSNMEGIAKIRAAEALVKMSHTRPDGSTCFTAGYNGTSCWMEILAWNHSILQGVNAWYGEKDDYLNQTGGQTGHYEALIDPDYRSIGLAGFTSDEVAINYGLGSYAGKMSTALPDDTLVGGYGEATQMIDVLSDHVEGITLKLSSPFISYGTSVTAKAVVQVSYSDLWGTVTSSSICEDVTWSSSDPSIATVSQSGTITGKNYGTTTITATFSKDGYQYSASQKIMITNGPAQIESIEPLEDLAVEEGKLPKLPNTVNAVLTDGQKFEVSVEWNESDYNIYSFATLVDKKVKVTGTAEGYPVTLTLLVPAATILQVTPEQDEITTDSGTEVSFPRVLIQTASGWTHSGYRATWDEEAYDYYKVRKGGTFTVNGTSYGKKVSFTLIVNPATVESIALTTASATVASGTAPVYPKAVITWSNGDEESAAVTWNSTDTAKVNYKSRTGGTYEVRGTVEGESVTFTVTVKPATVKSAVLTTASTTVASGTAPVYPKTAKVTWSNGDVTEEEITWNADGQAAVNYTSRAAGTYKVTGTVKGKTVTFTVNVKAATVTKAALTSTSITVASGTAPAYAKTAKVTWSNGDVTNETITWNETEQAAVNYKGRSGGTYTVTGTVKGKKVTLTVKVSPATVTKVALPASTITVASGTAPVYATKATVTWSNGDKTSAAITWNETEQAAVKYTSRSAGTYKVTGTARGTKLTLTVKVLAATVVSASLPTSSVTVASGTAPVYPEKATVTYSNGDKVSTAITWNEAEQAAVKYTSRSAGAYKVTGTVKGKTVTFTVNVKAATVTKAVLSKTSVTVASGTAPTYPSTASVSWSNGDVTSEKITWNETEQAAVKYTSRSGGTYKVTGTVKGKTVTFTVTVKAATVSGVALTKSQVTVERGVTPVYPKAVVTWSNHTTTTEAVTWNSADLAKVNLKPSKTTTYVVNGTIRGKAVSVSIVVKALPDVTVSYTTHVQTYGWQSYVQNGVMAGTSGQSKRLEGIKIKVEGNANLGIQYKTHCQTYGWLSWSKDGAMNGTTGESKRLEAIRIQLTGTDAAEYDVYYRVHAQTYGWLGWAKNGEPAGTAGQSKRLEGIQIVVVKKGAAAPGNTCAGITGNASAKSYLEK